MKKLIALFALCCITFSLLAQEKSPIHLENTNWSGGAYIPTEVNIIFSFKKDTVDLLEEDDNTNLEQMMYKLNGDTLTLKKITGRSPCGTDAIGMYKLKVQNNLLSFTLIKDECIERSGAFTESYALIKQ